MCVWGGGGGGGRGGGGGGRRGGGGRGGEGEGGGGGGGGPLNHLPLNRFYKALGIAVKERHQERHPRNACREEERLYLCSPGRRNQRSLFDRSHKRRLPRRRDTYTGW